MPLKFGLMFSMRNPGLKKPWAQIYGEMLEQAELAEELGFHSIWMSEHHFIDDGYCPSTLIAAAAAAARTKKITIGTRLLLLPLHNPVRVAEDAAVVDIISGGRFVLGMAIGYKLEEFRAFGIDRSKRAVMMNEGVEIIRKCWNEEKFTYSGKAYQFTDVSLQPKPVQKPLPIWLGARGGGAIDRVARMGDGWHGGGGPAEYEVFAAAMRKHGREPSSIPFAESRDVWVAEDSDRAWRECQEYFSYTQAEYGKWFSAAGDLPADRNRATAPFAAAGGAAGRSGEGAPTDLRSAGAVWAGNPDEIIAMYRRRMAEVPITHSIMRLPSSVDSKTVMGFMRLFAKSVMPALVG